MGERLREGRSSLWADPWNGEPIALVGSEHCGEAAEPVEQRASTAGRNPRHCSQHRLSSITTSFRSLRVSRSTTCARPLLQPVGEQEEPERGVILVGCPKRPDPELRQNETRPSDRVRMQRTRVYVAAFEEQVRRSTGLPQATDLRPETALDDRDVEVEHRLPFHERRSGRVIRDPKRLNFDARSQFTQTLDDLALPFEDVGHEHRLLHRENGGLAASSRLVSMRSMDT